MSAIAHPERDCIFDEAEASLHPATAHKYAGMPLRAQVEHYRAQGYPERHGLLAGGVIARDMRSKRVRQINDAWWAEILRWSVQDQLSLPYVLWKLNARCGVLDINLWRNSLLEVMPHLDSIGDLAMYASENPPRAFAFGPPGGGLVPMVGDWDGDGRDSPGLYDPDTGTFFLRNECTDGPADHTFSFGPPGCLPVAGDWNGDGRDSVGVFIPAAGYWALTNRHEPGAGDVEFHFGPPRTSMLPIAGDWNGRGRDIVGLYEPTESDDALLRNFSPAGIPERILAEDLSWAPDHLARYAFAAHWVAGRQVLDLCCGVGYGSNLLSAAGARKVLGVDINREAIDYARRRYESAGVEFICGDAGGDLPVSRIDVVTCFEGIEHVQEPEKMLATITAALDPSGIVFISSPNGAYYPGGFSGNPYHVKEYTRREFASLLDPLFHDVEIYFQWDHGDPRRPVFSQAPGGGGEAEKPFRLRPLPVSVLSEPECPKGEPLIWVALCRKPRGR